MRRLLCLAACIGLLSPSVARANAITQMHARLPEPNGDGFAHAAGNHILVHFSEVLAYRPAEDRIVARHSDFPPSGMPGGAASVWTGRYLYTFGGIVCHDETCVPTTAIHRVDPASGLASLMSARLPGAAVLPSAVWSGRYAYVFGGYCEGEPCADGAGIVRYDPLLDTVETMKAELPSPRAATYAIWAPIPTPECPAGCGYVFGGCCSANNEIVRYDPIADHVSVAAAFPSNSAGGRWSAPAVWSGRYAYVFGGVTCPGPDGCRHTNEIIRFDPVTGSTRVEAARLPVPRGGMASTWHRGAAYMIGGVFCGEFTCDTYDEIWRFEPGLPTVLGVS